MHEYLRPLPPVGLSWEQQRARAERLTAVALSVAAGAAAAAVAALVFG